MGLVKKSWIAPGLAMLLSSALYAAGAYTVTTSSLSEAIEQISEISKKPYIVDARILEGKKANPITGIENLEKALELLLEGSGLEAVIQSDTIVIRSKGGEPAMLNTISIAEPLLSENTEETHSYTASRMRTATKLGLSIRETPQSVMVLTQQRLEDMGVTSYQDMLGSVAGVSLNRWDERIYPTARGFKVDYYLIDGMPTYNISDSTAGDVDLSIYDRIEVVKGANGLMTGAGNPGVGLNFIRKHANSKTFKGDVEVSAGSWDAYGYLADVSAPLNKEGTIRGRLIAKHEDKNSFMDGYQKSNDVVYGVVDMDLTETTYLSLAGEYQRLERDGIRWGGLPAFYSDGTRTNFDRSKTVSEDWTYWNSETRAFYADFKQYLYEDISLNLSFVDRKLYSETSLLYFGGTVDRDTGNGQGYVYQYVNDALYHEQNMDAYLSIPLELSRLEHEIVMGFTQTSSKLKHNDWGMSVLASTLASPKINLYNINVANPNLTKNTSADPHKTTQTGFYLAGKFSLAEDWKLIGGARVSDWKYKSDTGAGNREFTHEVTPYAGLIYDLNENHSVYVSYTDIFKPQDKRGASGEYLDPIVGKNYETGIKGEYFDKRLNASLSLFKIEQDNVAEEVPGVFVPGTTEKAYKAASGVNSKGIELEINGEITDDWSLGFSLANFEAKDAEDKKVTTTSSRTMANLFTKYTIDKLSLGGGVTYRSKIYAGSGVTEVIQDAYMLANLMVAYKFDQSMKLQLNVNNLFDKKYYEGIGSDSMVYGAPRNVTLSFRYSF